MKAQTLELNNNVRMFEDGRLQVFRVRRGFFPVYEKRPGELKPIVSDLEFGESQQHPGQLIVRKKGNAMPLSESEVIGLLAAMGYDPKSIRKDRASGDD